MDQRIWSNHRSSRPQRLTPRTSGWMNARIDSQGHKPPQPIPVHHGECECKWGRAVLRSTHISVLSFILPCYMRPDHDSRRSGNGIAFTYTPILSRTGITGHRAPRYPACGGPFPLFSFQAFPSRGTQVCVINYIYPAVEDLLCFYLYDQKFTVAWQKQLARYPSCPQYTTPINDTSSPSAGSTAHQRQIPNKWTSTLMAPRLASMRDLQPSSLMTVFPPLLLFLTHTRFSGIECTVFFLTPSQEGYLGLELRCLAP